METKTKKTKKTKIVKTCKINRDRVLYENLRDLKALLSDKEEYKLG